MTAATEAKRTGTEDLRQIGEVAALVGLSLESSTSARKRAAARKALGGFAELADER